MFTSSWRRRTRTSPTVCSGCAAVYVAMNPVEAGLCSRPDEWPWSSHAAVIDGMRSDWIDVPRLLGVFGRDVDEGRRRYSELFE